MLGKITSIFLPPSEYPFSQLQVKKQGLTLYAAGLPFFRRIFTRDSIISGILARDPKMLRDQLSFCVLFQGKGRNPKTGEEPGKIFHQFPGKKIRGLSTMYNACDTTALFLIGHEVYQRLTGDKLFAISQRKHIEKASEYILTHLQNDLFMESPVFCGASKFALKVTYWKDSALPNRSSGEPSYPTIYTLAHVMNMRGLRSAAHLLRAELLFKKALKMKQTLSTLWDDEFQTFLIGIDQKGMIKGINSDSLHVLFYLDKSDISPDIVEKIVKSSHILETPFGYRTFDPNTYNKNFYHTHTVWPFENALIHAAGVKFGNKNLQEVSGKMKHHLKSYPELFVQKKNGKWVKGGDRLQLWTIAAKKYFDTHM